MTWPRTPLLPVQLCPVREWQEVRCCLDYFSCKTAKKNRSFYLIWRLHFLLILFFCIFLLLCVLHDCFSFSWNIKTTFIHLGLNPRPRGSKPLTTELLENWICLAHLGFLECQKLVWCRPGEWSSGPAGFQPLQSHRSLQSWVSSSGLAFHDPFCFLWGSCPWAQRGWGSAGPASAKSY